VLFVFVFSPGTPGHGGGWAETPHTDRTSGGDLITETPTPGASKRRSRWDETPMNATPSGTQTPGGTTPGGLTPGGTTPGGSTPGGLTPGGFTPSGSTPTGPKAMAMATPTPGECFVCLFHQFLRLTSIYIVYKLNQLKQALFSCCDLLRGLWLSKTIY